MSDYIKVNFLKVTQPIGEFYIGKISWNDLLAIAEADIRQIQDDEEEFDNYLGIQRKISPTRIKDISEYVHTIDATFPTSIILHINSEQKLLDDQDVAFFDQDVVDKRVDEIQILRNINVSDSNTLLIRKDEKVARILDGQHRIEGLRKGFIGNENIPEFDLNVTIFVDMDIDDQAQIFSVINKAQTKVNKSLVYDLYEYAKTRSPQKTAHDIVRLLNKMEDSPFYRKIKILGTAEDKETETIAQATFVELIINYISKNPMKDRDKLKRKSFFETSGLQIETDDKEIERRFFRNLFISEKDQIIMKILWNYFEVVKEKWPEAWDGNIDSGILVKSTGVIALMRFLRPVVNSINKYDQVLSKDDFQQIFNKIELEDSDFTRENYMPGSSGQSQLHKDLLNQSGIES